MFTTKFNGADFTFESCRRKHFDPIDTIYYLDTSRRPAAVLPLTCTKRPTCRLRGGLGAASVKCGGGGDFVCSQLGETCRDEEWHHHLWHVWNSGKSMTGPQRRRHGAAPPSLSCCRAGRPAGLPAWNMVCMMKQ